MPNKHTSFLYHSGGSYFNTHGPLPKQSFNYLCYNSGTGYWSACLRKMKVDVVAYDIAPPSTAIAGKRDVSKSGHNEYHGNVPVWTTVKKGTVEILHSDSTASKTLFMCYPPPDR